MGDYSAASCPLVVDLDSVATNYGNYGDYIRLTHGHASCALEVPTRIFLDFGYAL